MPCVSVVVSGDFCRFKLALPSLLSMSKDSDGKASLKQQKSLETSTDTQGMSKFLLILRVKYSYFEIFIVVNRLYFVPHTIPCNVFKFSTVPLVTWHWVTQRVTHSWINRDVSLGRLWFHHQRYCIQSFPTQKLPFQSPTQRKSEFYSIRVINLGSAKCIC